MKLPTSPGFARHCSRIGAPRLLAGSLALTGVVAGVAVIAIAIAVGACVNAPDIDGASIATIGSPAAPPACADVCRRLSLLCGYAPDDCVASCDAEYDALHRSCVGAAASCQEALETCANEEEADGGEEDAGEDSGETDAATDEDAGDSGGRDSGSDPDASDSGDGSDGSDGS